MPVVTLSSLADPRVADYRAVSDSDLAVRRGLFVAEGRLVVERLIGAERYDVQSILVTATARAALADALGVLDPSVPVFVAEPQQLESLTGFNLHRGCLALARRPEAPALETLLGTAKTMVMIDGVTNADNVGTIFRNARAFGVDAVVLSPTSCDPLYRKAIRTSVGASLEVPFARSLEWPADLVKARHAGFTIVGLTPARQSLRLDLAFRLSSRPSGSPWSSGPRAAA